ncbi:hypothetical protein SpCBS45565_g01857 [Spizellomyces sp. 'palustris']|nr:hypothetical protein SpCBS45565_g01857 [Spizellomyces sp. 'palustris']
MGYSDHRRFPDFTYISRSGAYDTNIDCVIISHFHLDHCGALPHFTEICGYSGPIYMTYPTKAICPILLEDMRKVAVERKGETNFFTSDDIRNCMKKVIPIDLHQTVKVDEELEIKAYYAGHVLGAAMFQVKVGNKSVVYTGDYNMTPDRHLGAAWIDRCRPDLLITETTYATTVRGSKRARERDFLKKVHDCVRDGGKVLIPVFALGRAQELCILLEAYWERMDDLRGKVPVYFSAGLTERAIAYYKLFINWTNEKIRTTFVDRNMFDFKYIDTFQTHFVDEPGPMVVFASPGMLHAGTSLQVFKKWCHDPKNMVILPGYCVAGTVGAKVLAGEKQIQIDAHTRVNVNLQVKNLSFSAHADAKGIMQLIKMCEPKNVMLVHGEKSKMKVLKRRLESEMGVRTFDPANGEAIWCGGGQDMEKTTDGLVSGQVLRTSWNTVRESLLRWNESGEPHGPSKASREAIGNSPFVGTVLQMPAQPLHILPPPKGLSDASHRLSYTLKKYVNPFGDMLGDDNSEDIFRSASQNRILSQLSATLKEYLPGAQVRYLARPSKPTGAFESDVILVHMDDDGSILDRHVSLRMAAEPQSAILVGWCDGADDVAGRVVAVLNCVVK